MNFKLAVSLLALLFCHQSFGQGTIRGKITDKANGESIPGVKVQIVGQNYGAIADYDGNYTIKNVPAGTHSVSFKYDTYNTKIVTDVVLKNNDVTTVDAILESVVLEIGPITVSVTVSKESSANLLQLKYLECCAILVFLYAK
jgi:hypothetical protein